MRCDDRQPAPGVSGPCVQRVEVRGLAQGGQELVGPTLRLTVDHLNDRPAQLHELLSKFCRRSKHVGAEVADSHDRAVLRWWSEEDGDDSALVFPAAVRDMLAAISRTSSWTLRCSSVSQPWKAWSRRNRDALGARWPRPELNSRG